MGQPEFPVEWEKERIFAAHAAAAVALAVNEHLLMNLHGILGYDCSKCESEHERLFLLAWVAVCERVRRTALVSRGGDQTRWMIHHGGDEHAEAQFRKLQDSDCIDCDGARHDWIAPQYPIAGRSVDFLLLRFDYAIANPKDPDRKRKEFSANGVREVLRQCRPVVVECGSEPGSRQFDRELQAQGYSVARFSGPELVADPLKCADEVDRLLSPELCHDQWRRLKAASWTAKGGS